MIFQHTWEAVLSGTKTQTRRRARGSYEIGCTYAVQPGRGKSAVGRIEITRIREALCAGNISDADAAAEGFESVQAWRDVYQTMHGFTALNRPCWVLEFQLVKRGREKATA